MGLSQQDLAYILNVGVATISRWENNECEPTGTAGAILATLTRDRSKTGFVAEATIGSSKAIYQLLKEHFERPTEKKRQRKKRG